jgi:serine/threonine-protein kinase
MPASRVGRFTLISELGSGGMGRVYRAHDPALARDVAIKVLRDDPGARGDLLSEARSASRLKHPNICAIYDVGDEGGEAFIAMELVDGRPLNEHIARGGLPIRTVLELAVQIASALAHAHAHGVVHGDLKGHNIVVTPKGDVKLLDFGLSRRPRRATLDSITQSVTAGDARPSVAGTLPFMAPETLRGAPLTPAADVWAFGVLLQELLTGERPFAGATAFDLASAIMNEPPRALPASVPPVIAAVVARCLEKTVARRYATALEPLAALEPLLSGPAATPPPEHRRPGVLVSWAAAGMALIAISAGLVWAWPRMIGRSSTPQFSSIIVLPFESLSRNEEDDILAEGMTDALITDLSRIPTLMVISRTSSRRYKTLGKTAPEIATELHVGAIVDGTVQRANGQVRISVRLVDAVADRNLWGHEYMREMKDVLALQGEVARAIAGEVRASFAPADEARLAAARSVLPEAHEEYLKGRHYWNRRTDDSLTQAIAHFRRAIDLQPDYAAAYAGLAQCYVVLPIAPLGAMSPTEAFPNAVTAAERAIALDDRLSDAHAALAYARLYLNGFDRADAEFQRALALNPNDATAHFWYAAGLSSVSRFDEAIQHATQAVKVDPVSPIIQSGVSWMHHLARRFDLEVSAARRALDLDNNFMIARLRLSSGLLHLGRYDEALVEVEKARGLTTGSPELIAAVGYAQGRAGQRRQALAALTELEKIAAAGQRYVSPFSIGLVQIGLGHRDEAFRWLQRAVDERHPVAVFLATEPDLDPLRADPRFAALVARARR